MSKKLGFIGCGNMGKAMIHGVLASGKAQSGDILASAKTESSREKNAAELGIRLTAMVRHLQSITIPRLYLSDSRTRIWRHAAWSFFLT